MTIFNARCSWSSCCNAHAAPSTCRELGAESLRIGSASLACAAAGLVVWVPLEHLLGQSFPAELVSVAAALAASGAAYVGWRGSST